MTPQNASVNLNIDKLSIYHMLPTEIPVDGLQPETPVTPAVPETPNVQTTEVVLGPRFRDVAVRLVDQATKEEATLEAAKGLAEMATLRHNIVTLQTAALLARQLSRPHEGEQQLLQMLRERNLTVTSVPVESNAQASASPEKLRELFATASFNIAKEMHWQALQSGKAQQEKPLSLEESVRTTECETILSTSAFLADQLCVYGTYTPELIRMMKQCGLQVSLGPDDNPNSLSIALAVQEEATTMPILAPSIEIPQKV